MCKKLGFVLPVIVAAVLAWCAASAHAQDAKTVVADASRAMGADDLKTLVYTGTGTEFSFGQAYTATGPWPAWPDKSYTRTINYETPGWRIDRVLGDIPRDRKGGGLPPGPMQTVMLNPNSPWAQQADLWLTPYGFLKAAASNNAMAMSHTMSGKKYTMVSFTAPSKAKVNGYINADNMVERVETWIDNPMLGDTLFEATYTDYKDFGGVKFPAHIVLKQGGFPTLDLMVSDVKPNAPAALQAPQGAGGGGGGTARSHFAKAGRRRVPDPAGVRRAGGRFQGRHRHHRRPAERSARQRHHRGSQARHPEQAHPVRGEYAQPFRSFERPAHVHRRGRDDRHLPGQQGLLRKDFRAATHAGSRQAVGSQEEDLHRDRRRQEGDDRRQPRHRAASHGGQQSQRQACSSPICPRRKSWSRPTRSIRRRKPTPRPRRR